MAEQRINGQIVSRMTVHIVWSIKYRYPVLTGDVQKKCRTLLINVCDVKGVNILKGVVSKNHGHMYIEYRPSQDISSLVKKPKERSSRLQDEFPKLNKHYWGCHFWAIGFGCWSTGNIADKTVNEYLEHHRKSDNDTDTFMLEYSRTPDFSQI